MSTGLRQALSYAEIATGIAQFLKETRRLIWLEQEYVETMGEVAEKGSLGQGAEALNTDQGNLPPSSGSWEPLRVVYSLLWSPNLGPRALP